MINSQTIKNAKAGNESAIQEIFSSFKSILQLKTKNYFFYGGEAFPEIKIQAKKRNRKENASGCPWLCSDGHFWKRGWKKDDRSVKREGKNHTGR